MAKKKATTEHGSRSTTDHDEIRRWAEQRSGRPATVKGTEEGEDAGILRIDFPGYGGSDSLQEISWEQFFEKFDETGLAFLYQDQTADGQESRFFKLVRRETADPSANQAKPKAKPKAKPEAEAEKKAGAPKGAPKAKAQGAAKAKGGSKAKKSGRGPGEPAA